jgi:hypothetical protein
MASGQGFSSTQRQCPYCGVPISTIATQCPACRESLGEAGQRGGVARSLSSSSSSSSGAKGGLVRRGLLYMLMAAVIHYFAGGYSLLWVPVSINRIVTGVLSPLLFLGGFGLFLYGLFAGSRTRPAAAR